MRNFFIPLVYFFIILPNAKLNAQAAIDKRILQPADMQHDFNYYRKILEDTHPGLYMHHTKVEMNYIMDSLFNSLNKPMGFYDFYKVIAYLTAEIKCEHSYSSPYGRTFNKNFFKWKLMPVQLYFSHGKAYVAVNRTADSMIHVGDEVLSVNQYPIDSIKHVLYQYVCADGNMETSKNTGLSSLMFNVYYYLFIERPDTFNIIFKNSEGQILEGRFADNLTFKKSNNLALKNPANKGILAHSNKQQAIEKNPLRLQVIKDSNTAILTIRSFSGKRDVFFKFYDSAFDAIQQANVGNLIIDVSDNGGGDEEFAGELMSYLIQSPTRFVTEEYVITDSDYYYKMSNIPKEILQNREKYIGSAQHGKFFVTQQPKYSEELKTFYPKRNRFTGKVFFYINGGTSSAASTFSAVSKANGIGTFIGEETAGSYAGGGSVVGLNLTLPNSKITAHSSIVYCSFATTGGDKDKGVIPDYHFVPAFDDLIGDNNGWKNFIFNLIRSTH